MNDKSLRIIPLSPEGIVGRSPGERTHNEAFADIPSLAEIAGTTQRLANRLGHAAYNALFFETAADDPGVRALQVELAMTRHHQASQATPDLDYFRGAAATRVGDAGLQQEDDWMRPS
jgi:hypothetical protein